MKAQLNTSANVRKSSFAQTIIWMGAALAICAFALRPDAAHALGVRVPNQDAAAIARGNAFTATADDPSAIYYNPAGITQIPGQDIQVGVLNYLGINTRFDSSSGPGVNSKFHVIPIPELYYTYSPEKLPLSFGLGIYAPFGLATEYPDPSPFRELAITAKLQYITINPVVAWKPFKTLSIAAGPTFNYSKIDIKRGLTPFVPDDLFQFSGEGWSYGMNAGILWQPITQLSFGANYRLASTMHYEGGSTYDSPAFPASPKTPTTADFQFPQNISGGISYRPTPKWNVEIDVDWTDWHTLRNVTLNGTGNNPNIGLLGLGGDLVLPLNWQGSWFYEIGATRYFEHGWFVSAGYFYSTESTSSADFTPSVPDTDLHIGSAGFGHKGEHWEWAAAMQIIAGPRREIDNTTNPSQGPANGSYKLFVPTLSVSAGYHF